MESQKFLRLSSHTIEIINEQFHQICAEFKIPPEAEFPVYLPILRACLLADRSLHLLLFEFNRLWPELSAEVCSIYHLSHLIHNTKWCPWIAWEVWPPRMLSRNLETVQHGSQIERSFRYWQIVLSGELICRLICRISKYSGTLFYCHSEPVFERVERESREGDDSVNYKNHHRARWRKGVPLSLCSLLTGRSLPFSPLSHPSKSGSGNITRFMKMEKSSLDLGKFLFLVLNLVCLLTLEREITSLSWGEARYFLKQIRVCEPTPEIRRGRCNACSSFCSL